MSENYQHAFAAAFKDISSALVERDEEVRLSLIAALSGESVLLVGPPGVAKSLLAESVGAFIDGRVFSYVLNKFSKPNELFGALNIKELEEGRHVRLIADTLLDAHVAFLDEIWKGSSAILNTLLKILNERKYLNGTRWYDAPLRFFMAASNEWPDAENGGRELGALFDRCLIRKTVRPVVTPESDKILLWGRGARCDKNLLTRSDDHKPVLSKKLSVKQLDQAREEVRKLPFTAKAVTGFEKIIQELKSAGIHPSDRRKVKSPGVAQASAYLAGSDRVELEHLDVLAHVLWDDPAEQPEAAAKIVMRIACPDAVEAVKFIGECDSIRSSVNIRDRVNIATALDKTYDVKKRISALKDGVRKNQALARVEDLRSFLCEAMRRED